jgi:hypothetical protein
MFGMVVPHFAICKLPVTKMAMSVTCLMVVALFDVPELGSAAVVTAASTSIPARVVVTTNAEANDCRQDRIYRCSHGTVPSSVLGRRGVALGAKSDVVCTWTRNAVFTIIDGKNRRIQQFGTGRISRVTARSLHPQRGGDKRFFLGGTSVQEASARFADRGTFAD